MGTQSVHAERHELTVLATVAEALTDRRIAGAVAAGGATSPRTVGRAIGGVLVTLADFVAATVHIGGEADSPIAVAAVVTTFPHLTFAADPVETAGDPFLRRNSGAVFRAVEAILRSVADTIAAGETGAIGGAAAECLADTEPITAATEPAVRLAIPYVLACSEATDPVSTNGATAVNLANLTVGQTFA